MKKQKNHGKQTRKTTNVPPMPLEYGHDDKRKFMHTTRIQYGGLQSRRPREPRQAIGLQKDI